MTIYKIRRVVVEVQEAAVEADTELDAAVSGKHTSIFSLVDRHVTVFDVQAVTKEEDLPVDPDMRT